MRKLEHNEEGMPVVFIVYDKGRQINGDYHRCAVFRNSDNAKAYIDLRKGTQPSLYVACQVAQPFDYSVLRD